MKVRLASIINFLFVCFVAFKPLYLRKSGGLQISDMFLLMLFVVLLFSRRMVFNNREHIKWLRLFFFVILYQLFINVIWTFVTGYQGYIPINRGDSMIFQTSYYLFNFLVSLCVVNMAEQQGKEAVLKLFIKGIMIASVIGFIGLFIGPSSKRNTSFFNNPNQLGYFSTITLTVAIMLKDKMKKYEHLIIFFSSLICIILSLSKAAIIPAALLLILQYLNLGNKKMTPKRLLISLFMILTIMYLLYLFFYSNNRNVLAIDYVRAVRSRINNMSRESDSDLYFGRGYGRIVEIGLFSIIGVGEGIYRRFTIMSGFEAHSLYASLIVSYGFVGFISYIFLLVKPFFGKIKLWYEFSLFVPLLLYNVSHNGIRNTLLWTLIAIVLVQNSNKDLNRTEEKSREGLI